MNICNSQLLMARCRRTWCQTEEVVPMLNAALTFWHVLFESLHASVLILTLLSLVVLPFLVVDYKIYVRAFNVC